MSHGLDSPVITTVRVKVGTTVDGGGGVGDGLGDGEGLGDGDGDGDGLGDGAGLGEGDGDGLGDDAGVAIAASSPPPHATSPAPLATEIESVKNSALRLMQWRARGSKFEAA
jgi:hypothetical protein